jgi:ubiquitin carboxyl-terminal hydrolase 12/46
MGGASPYRATRFISGQPGGENDGVPCDNGEKYFGLVNVANTCYANSVVQALYFCTPFRRAMLQHLNERREDDPNNDSLLTSLAELFAQIESQKRTVGVLTPRRFLVNLRKASDLFCTSEHQDAHEFLQFLLNDILESATKSAKRRREKLAGEGPPGPGAQGDQGAVGEGQEEEPRTWVHNIFQGYLVNQMKCLCCENVTVRKETFLDLSVNIERHTSIAACLRAFESTELLRAGNKFSCDTCGCLQEAGT